MAQIQKLSETQIDAIKEVANIGSGHAATALSQLLEMTVMIHVPEITAGTITDIVGHITARCKETLTVEIKFLGDLQGRTLFIYPKAVGSTIAQLLADDEAPPEEILMQSTLKEVTNITSGAYMNALGDMLDLFVLPSVPSLIVSEEEGDLRNAIGQSHKFDDILVCIETAFNFSKENMVLHSYFLLLPSTFSLQTILERLAMLQ